MRIMIAFSIAALFVFGETSAPLVQRPTVNRTHIAFVSGGDLWLVARAGGEASRLTAGQGIETDPFFSPDGTQIAFSGQYEGNLDVYVMPASGGVPRRLTWHPGEDYAVGWSHDGKRVLFRSDRERERRLLTVPVTGGTSEMIPLPRAAYGSFSADGLQLAYMPVGFRRPMHSYDAWKRYRGGRTTYIQVARLSDSDITLRIPRENSNDSHPMWVGNTIYFLSDRAPGGTVTLYSFDQKTQSVKTVLPPGSGDIKWATAGAGAIVYEKFGEIRLYDLESKKDQAVPIRVQGDFASVRQRFVPVARQIRSATLSPTGQRAVFEAHGEIITVPAEKGDARNITQTPGVHERTPVWSPDGKWIAYWSDAKGEYNLYLREQNGMGEPRVIELQEKGFYFQPTWSPDSKNLAFTDNKLNVWVIDIEQNTQKKIDADTYYDPLGMQLMDPAWAPDSKWLAYTKKLKNQLRAVFVYSLDSGKAQQVTDGMSDALWAQFDREGKYLYFTASTNTGLTPGWLDMTSQLGRVTRSVYLIVLRKTDPSPLAPESDDEKLPEEKKPEEKKAPVSLAIDFENIGQRILAVPIPPRDYEGLLSGKAGIIYVSESGEQRKRTIHKFDLKSRKTDKLVEGVNEFELSGNGEKMLYRQGDRWFVAAATAPPKAGEGALKVDSIEVRIDPRAEWKQMYREVWRIQRDWFYDPKLHGLNLEAQMKKYEPYLDRVTHRSELNYLFQDMLSDITVGHLYIRGGEMPEVKGGKAGLLGADYSVENGRYRFARVYNGENWNPDLRAPLTQPGVNIATGEYLLAVNGRDVTPALDVHAYFDGSAGRQTVIKVGNDPAGAGSREVTVVPIENENGLRLLAWVEENRRKVDQLSSGRLAYVYLPDTGTSGFTYFNRYFFSQTDKEGAILDERFNGGGQAADYIIDFLRRPLMNYWTTRYGEDFTTPRGAIFGPKAMIINEFAGSGGDALPWYFRRMKIGPLIGKRTWGGLIGILGYPMLMDGGTVTAPNVAFWNPEGKWEVENAGVAPDIEVELEPKAWREGHDLQLEKAAETVMAELKRSPQPKPVRPAFPDYSN